ncbi:IS element protein [Sulfolobus islandicus HVE10/4]|uniref:IS element protein n=1 Tax=Saccharolobus islandicus (strain HVE10/4) TaxID=930943 RepID=F0NMW1_SACI0|nr:IS element protein [Sulfolobus islandicus HVE10/4]
MGRQRYLCRDCGRYFLGDATYHHHSKKLREEALRLYANGMSMRAISRVLNVPLGTVFTWIKRYGGQKLSCGVRLRSWSRVVLLLRLLMRCGLTCTRILGLFTSGRSVINLSVKLQA